MPIEYRGNRTVFPDVVFVEEADGLLEWLRGMPSTTVEITHCRHLHVADLQVLMAARVGISSWPESSDLRAWLQTALNPAACDCSTGQASSGGISKVTSSERKPRVRIAP